MPSQRYQKRSREDHVIDLVLGHIGRGVDHIVAENPMPVGETRIDPRTAHKRLQLIPHDQLYEHLTQHG